jgi:ketosteroid isomerase-like protein
MADLKQIAQENINAFNAHDANAVAALDHPDVVSTVPGPTGRTELRGREAAKGYNQSWFNAFPDARVRSTNDVISGDYIVQEGTFEGTNTGPWRSEAGDMPATGRTLKGQFCQVIRTKDGQIVSSNLYFDQVQVLTQLGLMPAPAEAARR